MRLLSIVLNRALFIPNTFNIKELIRSNFDQYIDNEEAGKTIETPLIYTVPKDNYATIAVLSLY